jgi:hypothetical protein
MIHSRRHFAETLMSQLKPRSRFLTSMSPTSPRLAPYVYARDSTLERCRDAEHQDKKSEAEKMGMIDLPTAVTSAVWGALADVSKLGWGEMGGWMHLGVSSGVRG